VVAGAGDQAAGATGMGIVSAGAVSATIGTSGVVFAVTDRPRSILTAASILFATLFPDAGTSWASRKLQASPCAGSAIRLQQIPAVPANPTTSSPPKPPKFPPVPTASCGRLI